MNQTEHTSMIELLSIQITGDAEIQSMKKTSSEAEMPQISQDIKTPE
jgi:hypothetical protein